MPRSVNKVILVGYVGKDPEIRVTQGGAKIASFSIATGESWKDRNSGERRERTDWHNIVIFNEPLVKIVEDYVKKGSHLYVEGSMQTRKWTDKQGSERYTTEVVLKPFRGEVQLLDSTGSGRPPAVGEDDYGTQSTPYSARHDNPGAGTGSRDLDDEIPF